jgi:RNA polymerase sigma-70 factor, ECF subfamily
MSNSSKTDAELIQSILASNQDEFVVLMQRYQQKIFAYLYRFLYQNKDAALDVTQDVFIKAYENLGKVDLNRPFQPWIYRIAHNEAANYLRTISRKKENRLEDDQWDKIPGNEESDAMEAEEKRKMVMQAVDQLDPKYREVVVLFYFEEKSYKEIAKILDTSTNTVGTLISRAKKLLEKSLGKMANFANLITQLILLFSPVFCHSSESFSSPGVKQ